MTKHTPGPWQYSFEGGTVAFLTEADGTTIAKLSVTENSTAHKTLASNARLIAAAPEMLEALQMIANELPCLDNLMSDKEIARAAIAKATGEAPC